MTVIAQAAAFDVRVVAARLYRELGLVALLTVILGLGGVLAHHLSALPSSYTWLRPLSILVNVMGRPFFPLAIIAAWVLGAGAAGRLPTLADMRAAVGREPGFERAVVMRAVVAALVVVAIDATIWERDAFDRLLMAAIGAFLGARTTSPRQVAQVLVEVGFVAVAFSLISYGFTIYKALLFRVVEPNDKTLIAIESVFTGGQAPHRLLTGWAAQHPWLIVLSDRVYYLLFDHMFVVSAFLTGFGRRGLRLEYLGALGLCYLIGGISYYCYAGLGPVFHDPATYAFLRELPLTSNWYHNALARNTMAARDGTLKVIQSYEFIACVPSLHIAHELVMLWYGRHSRIFLGLSLAFTAVTLLAVVVLGWHYPIDIVTGLMLAALAVGIARWQRGRLLPRVLDEYVVGGAPSEPASEEADEHGLTGEAG